MAHHGLVVALFESVLFTHIPGIFSCSPVCLHPNQANRDVDKHSAGPKWLKGGHGEVSRYSSQRQDGITM